MWITRLVLTDFRNHERLELKLDRRPVVLAGPNGAGKTNVLEAVSLLAAGQGLRRVPYPDLARKGGRGGWAVAATVDTSHGPVEIGTGLEPEKADAARAGRIVRINGETQSGSGVLAGLIEMAWLLPSMDGLFTGPAGDRRRFLDRLVLSFDAGHGLRSGQFERAMRQRNRLLDDGIRSDGQFGGLERILAETGVAIAAARRDMLRWVREVIDARHARDPHSAFPWAHLELEGTLESDLGLRPAVDVEEAYLVRLAQGRERDRAAGRTLEGPHRSDLIVSHGPKAMPAAASSTGEQKALLIGLILAHAEMIAQRRGGTAPILLMDEVVAHLDEQRRRALFEDLLRLGSQAWLTGTDYRAFEAFSNDAQFVPVTERGIGVAAVMPHSIRDDLTF